MISAMPYSYDRTKTAAARGPIWDSLRDTWNELHDMQRQLEDAAHEYDVAASYRGGDGERAARIVLVKLKTAILAIENLAKSGGDIDDAVSAEMGFVKKFGTPEEYAERQRSEMYPR